MHERTHIANLHSYIDQTVTIAGWVHNRRDHGKLIFLDIRDATGVVQTVATPKAEAAQATAEELRPEWVVSMTGTVNQRPEKMRNPDTPMGDIELATDGIAILNRAETPPFELDTDGYELREDLRLQHRHIDLRRERLQRALRHRSTAMQFVRQHLHGHGFSEIDTPILTKSTPEGARDYVVPSRTEPGNFYALPQSPQQYKQLLMFSGFERYFQFARCMRDEDTRGDRQPEFTQLDMELAFVDGEHIMTLTEELLTQLVHHLYPHKTLTAEPWPRMSYREVMNQYGTDAPDLRADPNDSNELAFAWVTDFPLFEGRDEHGNLQPSHHMFTRPHQDDHETLGEDPLNARSSQMDLVLNGFEIGGGSMRIHERALQERVFKLIGFTDEQVQHFSHILQALDSGAPPHGGIAPGFDRLMMILENAPNIREVIAFPKTGEGRDLLMGAPSTLEATQLAELGIQIRHNNSTQ